MAISQEAWLHGGIGLRFIIIVGKLALLSRAYVAPLFFNKC
jgi:hypothetical protein